ncbi:MULTISPECIES: response regulator transcription factor [unclassified Inquilinus]|uniref:response regulator transcription factor n=1 Tax=unclassified Inquilinus TaxID=2645927 RepID=UPI003F923C20
MPDDRDLSNLIGQTYDAAIGDEDWAVLLERLKRAVGGTAAIMRWNRRPAETAILSDMDPAVHRSYDADYRSTDPIKSKVRDLPPGSVVDEGTLVPEGALERTEVYNGIYAPNDLHFCLSWYTMDPMAQGVGMAIYRPRRSPRYSDDELRLLRAIAPHLDRAVQIEGRLATAAARRETVGPSYTGPDLTRREQDCLTWIAHGESSKGIARQLALSAHTVNEYIASAMRKLDASSRTEAVATALTLGLLNL